MRTLFCISVLWKMATVKSLEDMLSSEVDESAVTALVGSLESQLASSNIQLSSQDVNTTSVTVNHVNNAVLVDGNVTRLLDGQKQGVIAGSQAVSLINVSKSAVTASSLSDASAPCLPTTTSASGVIATLPGALPASGYITQVTGPSQQTFFSPCVSGNITVNRSTNNQDIKAVHTSQSTVSQGGTTCTINTRSKTAAAAAASMPNGSPSNSLGLIGVRPNQTTPMSAIYDLATVASQQSPIVTSNSCNSTTTTTVPSTQVQVTVANGKQSPASKISIVDTKVTDKVVKPTVVPTSVVQTALLGTNVIQVNNATAKGTTGQPVSVVSQVVTNPSLLTPGVQIVNVNQRLGVPGLAGQKTLAPRVMLATNPVRIAAAPQILTARGGVAGQGTITLSPGMVRGAVLLKAENGQLQVVNIAGHPSSSPLHSTHSTYRLQSLTTGATSVRAVAPQQIVTVPVSAGSLKTSQVSVTAPQTLVGTLLQQGTTGLSVVNSRLSAPNAQKSGGVVKAGVNGNLAVPLSVQTTTANSQPSTPTQMSPNTAKKKCKNFLSTLIRLADEQPAAVAKSVRNLIQGIIDGTMQAEEFTAKLQKELNSAPQPYLVPFLKKNLPYLRHSLITKELTIEGVRPPPPEAVSLPHPASANQQQNIQLGPKRPQLGPPVTQVRLLASSTPTHCLLQQNSRFTQPRVPQVSGAKSLLVGTKSVAAASPATVTALQGKGPSIASSLSTSSLKEQGKRNFSSLREDDDLNDVAAMGGVNLVEESQRILASNAEMVGTQIRSCSDESLLFFPAALQAKVQQCAAKHGLEEVNPEVIRLISHASQERLKTLIEKLSLIAEHRMDNPKTDSRYEMSQDVRGQIKFLEELDRLERRRHEEHEREILLRAAKSRSKLEDPEQLKLKQKAKEMQRAEQEELRQREANTTALLAIGPRKKAPRLDPNLMAANQATGNSPSVSGSGTPGASRMQARPRVKRVNLRDLLYLMEQERETVRRPLLYKSYLK